MANPFGAVVDNFNLDRIPLYEGKTKRQEDRAREAMKQKNEGGKNERANIYVNSLKTDYGNGVTTLCLVYNATGDTISYVTANDWFGFIGRTPFPTEIKNGQWGAFLHIKTTSASTGSQGAVVYRGKNGNGFERDFLIAWSTPWGAWFRNKAYCEVGAIGSFPRRWDDIYRRINNADYVWSVNTDACVINANTGTGTSPTFTAVIRTPYRETP